MDYSIGKVSKLLDISVEGIRNYEKSDIIQSKRDDGSNYRKFSYLDIASLIRAKIFRSYGFSIKETGDLTNDSQLEEIVDAFAAKQEEIAAEIHLLQEKHDWLAQQKQLTQIVDAKVGKIEICRIPTVYRIEFACDGEIDFSDETVGLIQQWMQFVPFVYFSSRYNGDHVYGGLAIHERYASLFKIRDLMEQGMKIAYHPGTLGLCMTVKEGDEMGHSTTETVAALKEYARYHNFDLDEDMIGHTVMGIHKSTNYQRYRQVFAKIMNE